MKRKICYFINSDWYFELHWLDRGKAALDAGYDVFIVANFSDDLIFSKLNNLGFKCINSHVSEKNTNIFSFVFDTIRSFNILNKINPDIVHTITIKPGIIGSLWAKYRNKKLVYSFVGLGRIFESSLITFRFIKWGVVRLYSYLFSKVDCIVVFEHKHDQERILNLVHVARDKTVVIDGAGIDTDYFMYSVEKPICDAKVLFAGRMLWSKGLQDLVVAKRRLSLKGVNFEILVAGIIIKNDNDAISIEQIEEWHKLGDITWLGKRDDMNELIQMTSFVVLPSSYPEGIPRIMLEAGAVGRPCICYNVGGCGSLIKDEYNGYIVEQGDVKTLTDRIEQLLLSKNERIKMGLNARETIMSKYSSEIIIEKTSHVYNQLLS